MFWNPQLSVSPEGLPFRKGFRHSEFAKLLGVDPAMIDPDDYGYGTEV